jgi:hypothetical protein
MAGTNPDGTVQVMRETTGSRTSLPSDVSAYVFEAVTQVPLYFVKS